MAEQKNNESSPYSHWVWLDLEMTGLNEDSCSILQAAMIITDPNFKTIAEIDIPIWQPESVLSSMIPVVRSMHTKNNLLDRVRMSEYSLEQAENALMEILTKYVPYKSGILAGNTIYVDRRFVRKYMPTFESYLHYRQIDVSSLKIISQAWYGNKALPPKKSTAHTALQDIKDSIEELAFYKEKIFRDTI